MSKISSQTHLEISKLDLRFCSFWLNSSTSEVPKNFLELKSICLRYLENPPRSGLSNAPTLAVIRRIDQKILQIFNFCGKKPTLRYLFESDFSSWRTKYPTSLVMGIRSTCKIEWRTSEFFWAICIAKSLPKSNLVNFWQDFILRKKVANSGK